MTKSKTPTDALRDRLEAERRDLLPLTERDLGRLREDVKDATAIEREYRESPNRQRHSSVGDERAILLSGIATTASDELIAAEKVARHAARRIAEIDALLGAGARVETLRDEAAARARTIGALIERRGQLTGALPAMRDEAAALDARHTQEQAAAAEHELAARIAGKPAPAVAPDTTAADLVRLRSAIQRAESEIASGTARIAELRAEARSAGADFYAARHLAARLALDAALLALEPLQVETEAARVLAGLARAPAAPLDVLKVRRAMDAMAAELPWPPEDAEPSNDSERATGAKAA